MFTDDTTPVPTPDGPGPEEWFRHSFDSLYLALYAHRDEREADALSAAIERAGHRGPVLEVACGAGRFLEALVRRRERVVGLDLSPSLVAQARRRLGPDVPLVRGDMRRLPFREGLFPLVLFLFTSFGYFADPEEDRATLREAVRVLAPGGALLLDFLNAPRAVARLVPASERRIGELRVRESRWVDASGPFLRKRTIIEDQGREEVREERVRLYRPAGLEELVAAQGLAVTARWGDYSGSPFGGEESDRFLLWARKERA